MVVGGALAVALIVSGCGKETPPGDRALSSSPPMRTPPGASPSPQESPASPRGSVAASSSPLTPATSPTPTASPEALADCSYRWHVPTDTTPASLRVTLELIKTTLHRGETIHGELVIENVSDQRVYYWEGKWPDGLVLDGRWVGGFDNFAGFTLGYKRYWLDAGQVRRYPRDWQGFGAWGGTMDSLGCHKDVEERKPLPPGTYVAIVSFPVGEKLQPPWDEGAQDRIEIRIVP